MKRPTDVVPEAITEASGRGIDRVNAMNDRHMSTSIDMIHHLFVFRMSTNGLQKGFITHGRYRRLVYMDMVSFGTPILVNMYTEMLFTTKYGMPSAK